MSAQQRPSFCRMPPEKFAGRAILERLQTRTLGQFIDSTLALCSTLPKKPCKKSNILGDAEVWIKILAKALRHIGDFGADCRPMPHIPHITAKNFDCPGLNPSTTRDKT